MDIRDRRWADSLARKSKPSNDLFGNGQAGKNSRLSSPCCCGHSNQVIAFSATPSQQGENGPGNDKQTGKGFYYGNDEKRSHWSDVSQDAYRERDGLEMSNWLIRPLQTRLAGQPIRPLTIKCNGHKPILSRPDIDLPGGPLYPAIVQFAR
ncbi:hypothetical protein BaRGS_00005974 [Batillaria attramentaria]|uniref:Uncharacterized protein n=1 Tax=Batillaria attramentaria TaxID=370345 RepID=A0ABD0LT37_9CAEN